MSSIARKLGLARWAQSRLPRGSVDAIARNRVAGWAIASGGVEVEAWLDGVCIARARPDIARPDVADAFPHVAGAARSGFALDLPDRPGGTAMPELRIMAKPLRRWLPGKLLASQMMVDDALVHKVSEAAGGGLRGPFPKAVIDAIAAIWPEDSADPISPAGQARLLERVLQAMRTPSLNDLPAFAHYARYLTETLAHCRFVERHFPSTNLAAKPGANDFHAKPNSVNELFAIIHQLYVLQSWGVMGDFAEFGCFKGYSSAMLSFACAQLGIRMHVFDSFAGLPAAAGSGYEAGQYTGSLPEVRDNIRRFGCIDAVEFHPGFFAESLQNFSSPMLMCLWMDVDLEVSARDLLVLADRIDPRGSVFSHECTPEIFRQGQIVTTPHPDNPIHPLLARHLEMGRPLTGHHVAGYTGAFWPITDGTPVMTSAVLQKLMAAVR